MWNNFIVWLNHIFSVHCDICAETKVCKNCEFLKQLLEVEKAEKARLIDSLLYKPSESAPLSVEEFKPVGPKVIPWSLTKAELERNSREEARKMKAENAEREAEILRNKATNERKSIEELEKEAGVV
jgi:hypothetical protein